MYSSIVVVFCFIWGWRDPVKFKLTWSHRLPRHDRLPHDLRLPHRPPHGAVAGVPGHHHRSLHSGPS
uniref:Uncharacterized protein n=1 Tax=Oryza nivara TaxID=4536 RepID=A0A0E0HXT7_ORYNI